MRALLPHFEPRDLWVGVFWNVYRPGGPVIFGPPLLEVYVCPLPTLVWRFTWRAR